MRLPGTCIWQRQGSIASAKSQRQNRKKKIRKKGKKRKEREEVKQQPNEIHRDTKVWSYLPGRKVHPARVKTRKHCKRCARKRHCTHQRPSQFRPKEYRSLAWCFDHDVLHQPGSTGVVASKSSAAACSPESKSLRRPQTAKKKMTSLGCEKNFQGLFACATFAKVIDCVKKMKIIHAISNFWCHER